MLAAARAAVNGDRADRVPRRAVSRPSRRTPWSTCRRSRARRWTASPYAPTTCRERCRWWPTIAAGAPAGRALRSGEAMAISTGGVVPEGATAVVPIERVVQSENSVEIADAVEQGAHVRPRGGDVAAGQVVVEARRPSSAPRSSARSRRPASLRCVCARRPRVVVLTTGSELVRPGTPLAPGQVYEANALMLAAALEQVGAEVESCRRSRTTRRRTARRSSAVSRPTCSSPRAASRSGRTTSCAASRPSSGSRRSSGRWRSKPGKPVSFGVRGRTLVFGLPGNPVSSLVGCELFVKPALRALQGLARPAAALRARAARRAAAAERGARRARAVARARRR